MAADGTLTTETPKTDTPPPVVDDWRSGLPEDIRGAAELQKYTSVADLAKGHVNQAKLVGAKTDGMVKVPGKDAKPEEIAAFQRAIGVPESAEKYDLEPIKSLQMDESRVKDFLGFAHKIGLPNEQVTAIISRAVEWEQRALRQKHEQYLTGQDALADEWGSSVFDRRSQDVDRLIKAFAPSEWIDHMTATKEISHPGLIKFLAPIAAQFREAKMPPLEAESGQTVEDLDKQIEAMRAELLKLTTGSTEYNRLFDKYDGLLKARAELMPAKQ
jgi:hypothetical protein